MLFNTTNEGDDSSSSKGNIMFNNNNNETTTTTTTTTNTASKIVESMWLEGCDSKYTDYSKLSYNEIKQYINIPISHRSGPRGGVRDPFPVKLYRMLEEVEINGNAYIISWAKHGRSFIIHLPELFVQTILPHYFDHLKMTSFHRQLNLYGFKTIKCGPDQASQYNPLFLRGRTDLLNLIIRKKQNTTTTKDVAVPPIQHEEESNSNKHLPSSSRPSLRSKSRMTKQLLTFDSLPPICPIDDDEYNNSNYGTDYIQPQKAEVVLSSLTSSTTTAATTTTSSWVKNQEPSNETKRTSTRKRRSCNTAEEYEFGLVASAFLEASKHSFQEPLIDDLEPKAFAYGMDGTVLNYWYLSSTTIFSDEKSAQQCLLDPFIQQEFVKLFRKVKKLKTTYSTTSAGKND